MTDKQANNATFKLLVGGAFLNTTVQNVNGLIAVGRINEGAKKELRGFRDIYVLFKNYVNSFNKLRMESNRKQDHMDAKTRKMVELRLKEQGLEYSEERDLEEGYYSAAGDVSEFMDIWIKAGDAGKLDLLRSGLNEIKEGL